MVQTLQGYRVCHGQQELKKFDMIRLGGGPGENCISRKSSSLIKFSNPRINKKSSSIFQMTIYF